jgi:hypothetical protein
MSSDGDVSGRAPDPGPNPASEECAKPEYVFCGWAKKSEVPNLVLTGIIAVAALASVCYVSRQLKEMTLARIADERARIAPTGATLDDTIRVGKELRVRISFENTGKEPARNVLHAFNWEPFDIPKDSEHEPVVDLEKVPWPLNNLCEAYQPDPFGRPIYPSAKYSDIKYAYTTPDPERGKAPKSLIDRSSSFIVWGCFIYRTSEGIGQSPYCLYLQPHRTKPIEQWTFEFCPSGSPASQQQRDDIAKRFAPSAAATPSTLQPDFSKFLSEPSQPK